MGKPMSHVGLALHPHLLECSSLSWSPLDELNASLSSAATQKPLLLETKSIAEHPNTRKSPSRASGLQAALAMKLGRVCCCSQGQQQSGGCSLSSGRWGGAERLSGSEQPHLLRINVGPDDVTGSAGFLGGFSPSLSLSHAHTHTPTYVSP